MKIAIVNTLPIPSGQASVNRLLSYSKGLIELGDSVEVISSAQAEIAEGEIHGVKYRNVRGHGNKSLLFALHKILNIVRKGNFNAVIIVSNSLMLIYPLWIICKIYGIKIIQEKSEFPFVIMKKGIINKLWAKFYTATTYKLFDGLIVMTKPLLDYFSTRIKQKCKLIEVPMTVDLDRFSVSKSNNNQYGDYIAYCGNMAGNKDGVINLIDAFHIAAPNIPSIKLLLIGGSSDQKDFNAIKAYAADKGYGRIVFYGIASRNEIPHLLLNAKALALARPSSLQSEGGFPTKLGEYLATSNPVVVTSVGDIPHYLNKNNSYIVEPNNNSLFAAKIVEIFRNYKIACEIGKNGRNIAELYFNYKVQSKRIHEFFINQIL